MSLSKTFQSSHLNKLQNHELHELRDAIAKGNHTSLVSSKGTYWHIDHSLKAIIAISTALTESNPKKYSLEFSLSRIYIFSRRSIPRGVGKAPKVVLPPEEISSSLLEDQFSVLETLLTKLDNADSKQFFKHPYFGKLNKRRTCIFLRIHTRHHLKIIRDILKTV